MSNRPTPTRIAALIVLAGGVLSRPVLAEPVVLYVNSASTASSPGGASWPDAYSDLQDALDAASSLAGPVQIWVAEGTYVPSEPLDPNYPRSATFSLIDGVALYGGFPSVGTVAPGLATWAHRDPEAHPTYLSGDLGTRRDAADNCYRVVHADGVGELTVLDGFVITGGYADGPGHYDYGAGMYASDGSPRISRCLFTGNEAHSGGGIYAGGSGRPLVTHCEFIDNVAREDGGGLCDFTDGGGVVEHCWFEDNVAEDDGGAIAGSSPTVVWSTFLNNSADSGGGVRTTSGDPLVSHCEFRGNAATRGGAVFNGSSGNLSITNCALLENDAAEDGGAIYNHSSSATITNCSIVANSAGDWSGGVINVLTDTVEVANCILWGNTDGNVYVETAQIGDYSGSAAAVTYSCVEGGWSGTGNISSLPGFINAPAGNLHLRYWSPCIDAGDNSAVPADVHDLDHDGDQSEPVPVDLDGRARLVGSGPTVDMGCYERP